MERMWGLAAAGLLIAGGLVTVVVMGAGTPALGEDRLVRWVQEWPGWLEPLAKAVRLATGTEVVLVLGALGAFGLAVTGEWRRALCFGAVLLVLPFLQAGLKDVVDRERPSEQYVEVRDSFSSPSYPAGHVMSGTLLWGYVAVAGRPKRAPGPAWRPLAAAGAVIVALGPWANVSMGVHWPTDVLGGLFLGGGLAALAIAAERVWGRG